MRKPQPNTGTDSNSADKCAHWRMYKLWVLKGSLNIYIRKSYRKFPEFKERKALNYSPICDSLYLITHYFAIWRICIFVYMFTFICFCINQFTSSLTLGAWFCACAIPPQLKDQNLIAKWDFECRFYLVKASCPSAPPRFVCFDKRTNHWWWPCRCKKHDLGHRKLELL